MTIKYGLVIVIAYSVVIKQFVYSIYIIFGMTITNLSFCQTKDHYCIRNHHT